MGRWYEIAKYPNRFQKVCAGGTTATYTIEASGEVEVLNRCRKTDGSYTEARGAARRAGKKAIRELGLDGFMRIAQASSMIRVMRG